MSNEIKKLYKNVGLDNLWVERYTDSNGFEHENWHPSYKMMIKSMMEKNGWTLIETRNVAKKECHKELLPFTADKQLELVKWLALTRPVHINKLIDGWTIEGLVRNNKQYANFENAISGYINSIYPFLDEHKRAEIKEILK